MPAGNRLTATVHPVSAWDTAIEIVAGPATACETLPRTCLAGSDSGGSGTNDVAVYDNTGAQPVTVFVNIDGFSTTNPGTYDLIIAIATIPVAPPGDTCSTAVATAATTLTGETTVGYANNTAPGSGATNCTGFSNSGADKVYAITLTAGQILTATVTPTNGTDPSLYILQNPAACVAAPTSCLAGDDTNGSGSADTLTFTAPTAGTYMLVVDTFSSSATMTYNLTIGIQ